MQSIKSLEGKPRPKHQHISRYRYRSISEIYRDIDINIDYRNSTSCVIRLIGNYPLTMWPAWVCLLENAKHYYATAPLAFSRCPFSCCQPVTGLALSFFAFSAPPTKVISWNDEFNHLIQLISILLLSVAVFNTAIDLFIYQCDGISYRLFTNRDIPFIPVCRSHRTAPLVHSVHCCLSTILFIDNHRIYLL